MNTPARSGHTTTASSTLQHDTTQLDSTLMELDLSGATSQVTHIAWRRQVLLVAAIIGCLAVFFLARTLARQGEVPAQWRSTPTGQLELASSELPQLKPLVGQTLDCLRDHEGKLLVLKVMTTSHSARWIAGDEERQALIEIRQATTQAIEAGWVELRFTNGQRVVVPTQERGYLGLGMMFWLMSAFAVVLFMVGWIVPLVQPELRSGLYTLMALTQASQLLLAAISSVPALAPPGWLAAHEALIRTLLDLLTGAAIVHAAALHPASAPWRHWAATGCWLAVLTYGGLGIAEQLRGSWWWAQSLLIADGLLCLVLLTRVLRQQPHPFVLVMRRFCIITLVTLGLLTLAVSLMPLLPPEVQPVAAVGPVIWSVFFASVVLLVPFVARSQSVMREFAMLAGISTVATSVDLLFVAVFSFSQFASLTLSLFLALGAYAAIRQWLLNQMMGARALTTERMFQHLYRIAREVEARPERAPERMMDLLRSVFEPLEIVCLGGQMRHSRVTGNGSMLAIPLPKLTEGPMVEGVVVLRFAERGKRLFTPEDARLADRIVEQLMRAVAHDRAVERGRTEERARIAQDLHDDIGARLLTLMYQAPTKEMEDYVRHTLQDLKTLTRGLAAKQHALTLAAAEWKTDIAHRLEAAGCELEWQASFDEDVTLSVVQWSSLTRILRELTSNAIAHAKAKQVRVTCSLEQGRFGIRVEDDGVGSKPAMWSHGLGLGGIRKRVKLLGGTVLWREREGGGIACVVNIPGFSAGG